MQQCLSSSTGNTTPPYEYAASSYPTPYSEHKERPGFPPVSSPLSLVPTSSSSSPLLPSPTASPRTDHAEKINVLDSASILRQPAQTDYLRFSLRKRKPVQRYDISAPEPSCRSHGKPVAHQPRKSGTKPSKTVVRQKKARARTTKPQTALGLKSATGKRPLVVILPASIQGDSKRARRSGDLPSPLHNINVRPEQQQCTGENPDVNESLSQPEPELYALEHPKESVGINDYLLEASRNIMRKTSLENKPAPRAQPRVWADTRQAFCETLAYYQAWQSSCYASAGVLYSFMFDSNGHERDLIDQDVIIARATGAMSRDETTGRMVQCRDQIEAGQVQTVRAAIASQGPIPIFCGNGNTDVPVIMPHRYNSLDWFKVTHVWAEKSNGKGGKPFVTMRYRFEKLTSDDDSWWVPEGGEVAPSVGTFDAPETRTCSQCHSSHQTVYLQGWMCLNPLCTSFWRLPDGQPPQELDYDPRFVKQKTPWSNERKPYDLRPQLPDPSKKMGEDTSYAMTRGICCPKCGKCTSRYQWKGWSCSNENCDFDYFPEHTLIPSTLLRDPQYCISHEPARSYDFADPAVVAVTPGLSHNYRIMQYRIAGIDGLISHFIANETVLRETNGPDEMFKDLQTLDCGLERRKFASGKEGLMTAFSTNHGMPYKFVASVDSQPFEGAPWPLIQARSRLNWASRLVAEKNERSIDDEFNELLTIGYFDGQDMKYHDDGEHGLGPTVASLSLGSATDMSFRVKAAHWTGISKSGVLNTSRPLPGTVEYQARLEVYNGLQSSNSRTTEELRTLSKQLGLKSTMTDRKAWLRLRLAHGDMVVMHGRQIQEYLEHKVEAPKGLLRFALTARTILPEHLKPEERPQYEVLPDARPYDGSGVQDMAGAIDAEGSEKEYCNEEELGRLNRLLGSEA